MDIVSVASSIVVIVSLVNNVHTLLAKYSSALQGDPRLETLYWKMWTEKKITSAWFASARRNPNAIAPDEIDDVEAILQSLRVAYDKAEKRMRRFDKKGKRASVLEKLDWMNQGYDDLKALVDVVETLNTALKTVAPPLPLYSELGIPQSSVTTQQTPIAQAIYGNLIIQGTAPRIQNQHVNGNMQFHGLGDPTDQLQRLQLPSIPQSTTSEQRPAVNRRVSGISSNEAVLTTDTLVKKCVSTCSTCLTFLSRQSISRDPALPSIEDAFKLWSSDLFGHKMGLEYILAIINHSTVNLRRVLLNVLVEIAFTQGRILARWADESRENSAKLIEPRAQISTLLEDVDLTVYVADLWQATVEQEACGKVDSVKDLIQHLSDLMEVLNEILPAIRSLRKSTLLMQERMEKLAAEQPLTLTKSNERDVDALVENNIRKSQQVREVTQGLLADVPDNNALLNDLGSQFRTTTFKLKQWNVSAQSDGAILACAQDDDVLNMQQELAKHLDSFLISYSEKGSLNEKARSDEAGTVKKSGLDNEKQKLLEKDLQALNSSLGQAVGGLIATMPDFDQYTQISTNKADTRYVSPEKVDVVQSK